MKAIVRRTKNGVVVTYETTAEERQERLDKRRAKFLGIGKKNV